jgi:hypothetical protein
VRAVPSLSSCATAAATSLNVAAKRTGQTLPTEHAHPELHAVQRGSVRTLFPDQLDEVADRMDAAARSLLLLAKGRPPSRQSERMLNGR